ncbi:hypothetical protein [Vibrio neptunius]|uniref:hypothetical protein n=1 Tax=Vibrio neptunius TaxID=170651 RepID=UPI0019D198C7|nr:hypothetical protein [Vibrio neptunius]MBN3573766.1 hypothetical protein [Vibrio neptunius]
MISNQSGLSFIEVLLTLLLLSSSAFTLVKLHVDVEAKSEWANHATKALHLAESKLERFTTHGAMVNQKNYPFEAIDQDPCFALSACQPSSSGEHQIRCQSKARPQNGIQLKLITVEVCWKNRHGKKLSVVLTTSISKFNEFSM